MASDATDATTAATPEWLLVMRAMDGTVETPGSGDNPKILAMRDTIASTYSDMASYCALYQHDATPWCGLAVAYAMTMGGVRPVFGPTDTDRWMWAQAWDDEVWGYKLSVPRPGCVVVMKREGGGHVTLYERTEGSYYWCRGGNQSDAINQSKYPISNVIALMWPKAEGPPPPAPRREIAKGATGPDVKYLQVTLGIPADGEFGNVTDAGVKGYQTACGLVVDGVVGPATWAKVDALALRVETGNDGISATLAHDITEMAIQHPIHSFVWNNRGRSPVGYIPGIGQCYALALTWLAADDPAALEMSKPEGDAAADALAWYGPEYVKLGIHNTGGVETLRSLFALLIGLGMRESSGKYYEGIDVSAGSSSQTSDTCEAGLFQMSWNMKSSSLQMSILSEAYWTDPNGFLAIFSEGLTPTAGGLKNVGSGEGAAYQFLAKYCPAFAAMTAAVGLRNRRKHWGPIVRKEVELVEEAIDFLREVETIMAEGPTPPEPPEPPEPVPGEPAEVTITVTTTGDVKVNVIS